MIINGFSIVICSYNGSTKLPETLRHIAMLQIPPNVPCELVIVNNASTDNTEQIAREKWKLYTSAIHFRIVNELNAGLSNARRRGFEEARYEFVLFCDDDNWLNSDYLMNALDIFGQHADIGVLGGKGIAEADVKFPYWFPYVRLFAIGSQSFKAGPIPNKKAYGAGLFIRKSAYETIKAAGFEELLSDRLGNGLSAGGDYELCLTIALAGYQIWYSDALTFKHYFPKERLNKTYYYSLIKQSAPCLTILDAYSINLLSKKKPNKFFINFYLLRLFFHCLRELVRFFIKSLIHSSHKGIGSYARFRMLFFKLRIKGLFTDFFLIHACAKKVHNVKQKLNKMSEKKSPQSYSEPPIQANFI